MADKLAAGTLPAAQASVAPQLIFNQRLDALLAGFFTVVLWIIIADAVRVGWRVYQGKSVMPLAETPYVATQLTAQLTRPLAGQLTGERG